MKESDSGYMYCPYIPMYTVKIAISDDYILKFEEKKDYNEFFKRYSNTPIIYRSKKGWEYNAELIKLEENGFAALEYLNKFGKKIIKKCSYYEKGHSFPMSCWWFKDNGKV